MPESSQPWISLTETLWKSGLGHLTGQPNPESAQTVIRTWLNTVQALSRDMALMQLRGEWSGDAGQTWRIKHRSDLLEPTGLHPALAGLILSDAHTAGTLPGHVSNAFMTSLPAFGNADSSGLHRLRVISAMILHLSPITAGWTRPEHWNALRLNVEGHSPAGNYAWEAFPLITGEKQYGRKPLREREEQLILADLALTWTLRPAEAGSLVQWLGALQAYNGPGAPTGRRERDGHNRPTLTNIVQMAARQVAFGSGGRYQGDTDPGRLEGWLNVTQRLADECDLSDEARLLTGLSTWKLPDDRLFLRHGQVPRLQAGMKRALLSSSHPLQRHLWTQAAPQATRAASGSPLRWAPAGSGRLLSPLQPSSPAALWKDTVEATIQLQARWVTAGPLSDEKITERAVFDRLNNLIDHRLSSGLTELQRALLGLLTHRSAHTISGEQARDIHLRLQAGHLTVSTDPDRLSWADDASEYEPLKGDWITHKKRQEHHRRQERQRFRKQISTPLPEEALLRTLCLGALQLKTEDPQTTALQELIALHEQCETILSQRGRPAVQCSRRTPTYTLTRDQLLALLEQSRTQETP